MEKGNVYGVVWDCLAAVELPGRVTKILPLNGDVIIESGVAVRHPDLEQPATEIYLGVVQAAPAEGDLVAFRLKASWTPRARRLHPEAIRDSVRVIGEAEWNRLSEEAVIRSLDAAFSLSSRENELRNKMDAYEAAGRALRQEGEQQKAKHDEQAVQFEQQRAEHESRIQTETAALRQQQDAFERAGGARFLAAIRLEDEIEGVGDLGALPATPPPADLLSLLHDALQESGLRLAAPTVRRATVAFTLANALGQLWLLAGPPGTGKTTLATAMSTLLGAHVSLVPVRPGWLDSSDLLGYLDPREGRFVAAPVLDHLLAAVREEATGRPHNIILDELNIARIENYGADFLALLEKAHGEASPQPLSLYAESLLATADRELAVALGAGREDLAAELARRVRRLQTIPPAVMMPSNLIVTGTLNDDDTTNRLSPKVLDRSLAVRVPYVRPELGEAIRHELPVIWRMASGWTERLLSEAEGDRGTAANLWERACKVVEPEEHSALRLSHRTARCVALLPALSRHLDVSSLDLLDDVLVMKALPWISAPRDDVDLREHLTRIAARAEVEGLSGLGSEIADLLQGDDDVMQYMR